VFESFWPDLESEISKTPSDQPKKKPERTSDEVLREILDTVRDLARRQVPLIELTADDPADTYAKSVTSTLSTDKELFERGIFG
jgi:hypothetical protein